MEALVHRFSIEPAPVLNLNITLQIVVPQNSLAPVHVIRRVVAFPGAYVAVVEVLAALMPMRRRNRPGPKKLTNRGAVLN